MTDDPSYLQRKAQEDFWKSPTTPAATEQSIPNAESRARYNAELSRQADIANQKK